MIEEETNPLWMPRGSVRALLTLGMTILTGYMVASEINVPEWWQLMNGGAIAGYGITRYLSPRTITVKEPVHLEDVDLLNRGNL